MPDVLLQRPSLPSPARALELALRERVALDDIHGQLFNIKQTIATVWLKESHTDEGINERELACRRAVLRQPPRGGADGAGASQPRATYTQSELVRYGINQARPVFESCIGEAQMNQFIAYIHEYKNHRPKGARARRARARRATRRTPHTAHLARIRCALRRHERARAAGGARRARRDFTGIARAGRWPVCAEPEPDRPLREAEAGAHEGRARARKAGKGRKACQRGRRQRGMRHDSGGRQAPPWRSVRRMNDN